MNLLYDITNATKKEEKVINQIISYITDNYNDEVDVNKLHQIEVVDKLDNDSSGRSIRDKIFLPRKYGLEGIESIQDIIIEKETNLKLKMLIGTIYHEMWHVSTWSKYETMYEYVLNEKESDMYTAYAYMYWIEYIAHVETVFMEVPDVMKDFCKNFVQKRLHKIKYGYSYFVKALPYYLVRSKYLNLYDELTQKIISSELRQAVYDFDNESKVLLHNKCIDDIEKANVIKRMIEKLFL